MKIHSFIFDFLLYIAIFLFFALNPIVNMFLSIEKETYFTTWSISFFQFIELALCILLIILYTDKNNSKLNFFQYSLYKIFLPATFVLSLLFFVSLIFQYISIKFSNLTDNMKIVFPENFISWMCCFLNFGIAAFFEEVIYRFYLVDELLSLIKKKNKFIIIIIETIVCFLFAIGHLYMGFFSVLNAVIAHIILRCCYKFSGNIYSGFLAHLTYNIISLILL